MLENKEISSFNSGDEFIGFYAVKKVELKESDGSYRMELELSDRTGTVQAVIWDDPLEMKKLLQKGDIVKVKGIIQTYREKLQVKINKIRLATSGEYSPESFLPACEKGIEDLLTKTTELIKSIKDENLSKLTELVFENKKFIEEYKKCPGGTQWHHPYIGGLLEHSLGVAEVCDKLCSIYPQLNRDLLITAAFMHDVGKIREYSVSTVIEYSDEGRLEGHIVIGERFVREMIAKIKDFPDELRTLLCHMILSHQGHKDFGSPVEPMTPEAFILYFADEIDSKMNALERIRKKTRTEGENWSEFVRILNRFIYFESNKENEL